MILNLILFVLVSRYFGWSSIFCFMSRLVNAIKDGHGRFYDL